MKSPHPNEIIYAYMFTIYFIYRSISHIRLYSILSLAFMSISYCVFSGPLVLGNATWKINAMVKSDWKCHMLETPPPYYAQKTNTSHVLRNLAIRISFNFIDSSIPNMFKHELLFSSEHLLPSQGINAPCNNLKKCWYIVIWQLSHGAGQNPHLFDNANA